MTELDFQQREAEQEAREARWDLHPNSILVANEPVEPALDILCEDKEMEE